LGEKRQDRDSGIVIFRLKRRTRKNIKRIIKGLEKIIKEINLNVKKPGVFFPVILFLFIISSFQ